MKAAQADPSSLLHTNFRYAELVQHLPYVFAHQLLPSKNKYRGSGKTEVFMYHKTQGDDTHDILVLDFTGEHELAGDICFSYYSRYPF